MQSIVFSVVLLLTEHIVLMILPIIILIDMAMEISMASPHVFGVARQESPEQDVISLLLLDMSFEYYG